MNNGDEVSFKQKSSSIELDMKNVTKDPVLNIIKIITGG